MRIQLLTEIEIVLLNDWSYHRGRSWWSVELLQLSVKWGEDGSTDVIVRITGFGLRLSVTTRD